MGASVSLRLPVLGLGFRLVVAQVVVDDKNKKGLSIVGPGQPQAWRAGLLFCFVLCGAVRCVRIEVGLSSSGGHAMAECRFRNWAGCPRHGWAQSQSKLGCSVRILVGFSFLSMTLVAC